MNHCDAVAAAAAQQHLAHERVARRLRARPRRLARPPPSRKVLFKADILPFKDTADDFLGSGYVSIFGGGVRYVIVEAIYLDNGDLQVINMGTGLGAPPNLKDITFSTWPAYLGWDCGNQGYDW